MKLTELTELTEALADVGFTKHDDEESSGLDRLYHGTKLALIPDIMKNGLDPSLSTYADDEEANDYAGWDDETNSRIMEFGPPYHFVFLSDHPETAMTFMPGGEYHPGDPNQAALLEISLPPELQEQLVLDRGEFIRAPFVIPPRYIKRIK